MADSSVPYLEIPTSVGDVVDRLGILSIKLERVTDPRKSSHIRLEYELLASALGALDLSMAETEVRELERINRKLWAIEDAIRKRERSQCFDRGFIELARQIYLYNDQRAALKRRISLRFGSRIVEEKVYTGDE